MQLLHDIAMKDFQKTDFRSNESLNAERTYVYFEKNSKSYLKKFSEYLCANDGLCIDSATS